MLCRFLMKLSNESVVVELKNSTVVQASCWNRPLIVAVARPYHTTAFRILGTGNYHRCGSQHSRLRHYKT